MKRLQRVRRLEGLQRLSGLGGKSRRREKVEIPRLSLPRPSSGMDDYEYYVFYNYGDKRLAGRIAELHNEFPDGSVPELVVLDWLRWKGIDFAYQASVFGGWARAGGLVPDFILKGSHEGRVLQVQGDYWHAGPNRKSLDASAKLKLVGTTWKGIEIKSVTFIWEGNLKDPNSRETTLQRAIDGIETPRR